MSIKYVSGDLFGPLKADAVNPGTIIVPHVCNNKGGWGAGFVIHLSKHYPKAEQAYRLWSKTEFSSDGKPFKMGEIQFVRMTAIDDPTQIIVVNMIAQTLGGKRPLYYNHLAACMTQMVERCPTNGSTRIHAPMFGSKLAGGRWDFIEELIYDCWIRDFNIPVNIYYLPGQTPEGWEPPTAEK